VKKNRFLLRKGQKEWEAHRNIKKKKLIEERRGVANKRLN